LGAQRVALGPRWTRFSPCNSSDNRLSSLSPTIGTLFTPSKMQVHPAETFLSLAPSPQSPPSQSADTQRSHARSHFNLHLRRPVLCPHLPHWNDARPCTNSYLFFPRPRPRRSVSSRTSSAHLASKCGLSTEWNRFPPTAAHPFSTLSTPTNGLCSPCPLLSDLPATSRASSSIFEASLDKGP
jgi:hypothetical protein